MKKNMNIREYIYLLMTDKDNSFFASILKGIFYLASLLYLLALKINFYLMRNGIFKTVYLEAKVISVGNITLGGTGKTPLVELVSRIFIENAKKVAILTRGYKIAPGKSSMPAADEPELLRIRLPQADVLAGPDRVKTGRTAICNYGADVLILDDGFQYWRLSRDTDILAIDATNPYGNGNLLPRGILREPVANIVRAGIIVITKADAVSSQQVEKIINGIKSINPDAHIFTSTHGPEKIYEFANFEKMQIQPGQEENFPLEWLKDKKVLVVCGIGDPDYFVKTIESLGGVVGCSLFFQDHHPYVFGDLELITKKCRQTGVDSVLVTEKDMIKLRPLIQRHILGFESFKIRFLALGIKLRILENEQKFRELILSK